MARSSVQHFHVNVGPRTLRESFEEIGHQLGLQIAYAPHLQPQIDHRMNPSAEIDRRDGQCFVHRHHEITCPIDPAPIPERGRDGFAQCDTDILDGVMLIDIEIAIGRELQIERAMPGKQLEHVIEKPDPGMDVIATLAVK